MHLRTDIIVFVLVARFNPDTKSVLMQTNWPSRVRVVCATTSFVAVQYRSFVVWPERIPQRLPPCWYSHTGDKKAIYETFADRTAVNSRYANNSWSLKSEVIGNLKNFFFFWCNPYEKPLVLHFPFNEASSLGGDEITFLSRYFDGFKKSEQRKYKTSLADIWPSVVYTQTRRTACVCAGNENRSKNILCH